MCAAITTLIYEELRGKLLFFFCGGHFDAGSTHQGFLSDNDVPSSCLIVVNCC
jgi:hypothetical protein